MRNGSSLYIFIQPVALIGGIIIIKIIIVIIPSQQSVIRLGVNLPVVTNSKLFQLLHRLSLVREEHAHTLPPYLTDTFILLLLYCKDYWAAVKLAHAPT